MRKIVEKFKKNKYLWGVVVIMLLAIFWRGWMFSDLLTFKMDQARDINLIEEAYRTGAGKMTMKGLGELPLLGPRAAKTYLRLGPISYYFEYLSLLIFGDKPWSMAVPDFIFSILTIPLFYYFLRQGFNKKISFLTTMVFASSFFLTQYGRFAWNPNSIPFWSLLYFLGLYKVVKSQMLNVESQKSGKWLLVATIGYGVASQLHFTAMLAYPVIGVLFVLVAGFLKSNLGDKGNKGSSKNNFQFSIFNFQTIFKDLIFKFKNKEGDKSEINDHNQVLNNSNFNQNSKYKILNIKYLLGAVVILGVMYFPMILSEICTHGDNWTQFKYALSGRGKEEFPLKMKIIQSLKLHSEYFWYSLTSWGGGARKLGVVGFVGMAGSLFLLFLYKTGKNFQFSIFNYQRIFNGLIFKFKKEKNNKNKTVGKNKSLDNSNFNQNSKFKTQNSNYLFFLLIWIWFGVMFLLYTKLAFNVLKPRYWLLEAPIFFVVLAVVLDAVSNVQFFKRITRYKIQGENKSQDTRYKEKINHKIQDTRYKQIPINKIQDTNFGKQKIKKDQNLNSINNNEVWSFPKIIFLQKNIFSSRSNISVLGKLVVIVLVGLNLWATGIWYWKLQNQQDGRLFIWDLKLKDQNEIPWGQLQKSADYIEELSKQTRKDICFYTTGEYRPVYDYIFEKRNLSDKIRRMSFKNDNNKTCLFIAIDHHRHRKTPRIPKDHKNEFDKVKKKEIGFITVWEVSQKSSYFAEVTRDKKVKTEHTSVKSQKSIHSVGNPKLDVVQDEKTEGNLENLENRGDLRNKGNSNNLENKEEDSENKKKMKKPKRKERVRWKDIWKCGL